MYLYTKLPAVVCKTEKKASKNRVIVAYAPVNILFNKFDSIAVKW